LRANVLRSNDDETSGDVQEIVDEPVLWRREAAAWKYPTGRPPLPVDDAVLSSGSILLKRGVRVMTVFSPEHRATLMSELEQLISEERNPNTMEIDLLPTAEVLRVMNREDRSVADAVGKVIAEIACSVDCIVDAFGKGGRLIYMGAGTSGRLGVLDAAECPATFSVPADMVVALIAGGAHAFSKAT
jgi:hypothetical protein